ncbi:MAG: hypothetical protein EOP05_11615 [Proteobacteria bacterium]|nr:MAG: hypothetical protein EOP05_11615 [Pseudomonadota bacterium]
MTRVLTPLALALMILFLSSSFAFAQDGAAAKKPAAPAATSNAASKGEPKKTTVNFEDQLIEGQTQKPELFYLLQQRNNNFKRLIKLRENFLPEMRKTGEDFSRTTHTTPQAAK